MRRPPRGLPPRVHARVGLPAPVSPASNGEYGFKMCVRVRGVFSGTSAVCVSVCFVLLVVVSHREERKDLTSKRDTL